MTFLLTLFFISLLSIIFMIGRKLVFVENIDSLNTEETTFEIPYIKEIKSLTGKGMRTYGHASLVIMLRIYIKSSNLLKNKYGEMKVRLNEKTKNGLHSGSSNQEINNFLKKVSDYKHKIREIKKKIHEEEKNS